MTDIYENLRHIMGKIKKGSIVLYDGKFDFRKIELKTGIITEIAHCEYLKNGCDDICCYEVCIGKIGIDNNEPICMMYGDNSEKCLIKHIIENFITEDDMKI